MGTGFSLDPNEHRAAASVIEGYGSMQQDHGTALASATSTPLSSSNSGIAGAISQIATGTVQKIVTDVTSTTKGFADDTAKGLRAQANKVEQLETDLASHAKSILSDPQSSLLGGLTNTTSPLTSSSYAGTGMSTTFGSPLTSNSPLAEGELGEVNPSTTARGESNLSAAGAGVLGEEASAQESSMMPLQQMRTGTGAAGTTEERGQRPDYLKSKTEITDTEGDRTKAAIHAHQKECGTAPIPLSPSQLVCAKCGSILQLDDSQALAS
jgi:hypothetical protein